VGKFARVLIDGESRKDSRGYNLTSRTSEGRLVLLKGSKELIGQFRNVLITDSTTWSLCGEIC